MEWRDDALVLSARRHGETSAVVSLLTRERGRHLGLVRGGQSRGRSGMLQPGNRVLAAWRARLPDHLGTLTLEPAHDFAAAVLDDPARLKALASAAALLDAGLAEREPHPGLFGATETLLTALEGAAPAADGGSGWAAAYVRWELALLAELGFGLDLERCAATGTQENLVFVSPRTGRAVSADAGAPYRDRLLPLPAFLLGETGAPASGDVARGLRLTGHFLERCHFAAGGGRMPPARSRLVEAFMK